MAILVSTLVSLVAILNVPYTVNKEKLNLKILTWRCFYIPNQHMQEKT